MDEVRVAVLYGFGINCDRETAAVFELVGAKSTRVHLNEFISKSLDISYSRFGFFIRVVINISSIATCFFLTTFLT